VLGNRAPNIHEVPIGTTELTSETSGGHFFLARLPSYGLHIAMSYVSQYSHFTFSTKERRPVITPDFRERLWEYMGGIAREHKMAPIAIGGVADHVHLLLTMPATMSVAKAIQTVKAVSSKWVHETFPDKWAFRWQAKYGSFSVSASQVDRIVAYIKRQEQHHKKMTFQEEFRALLIRHKIVFDEKYLWD
jgi:putative transposase